MSTRTFSSLHTPAFGLVIALLAASCGNDTTPAVVQDGTATTTTTGTTGSTSGQNDAGNTTGSASTTAEADRTGVNTMETTDIRINGATPGTPVYNERYAASKDIRGYRAMLMAELDAIRARLNDGTRPADVAKKDQDRAADLAQGLERMDRLIKAVEESDDLTWTTIRESQLKQAGEVRTWAAEHGYKVG